VGPKERREREREKVRGRILEAARELFVSDGYEAVTMRRIADRIEYTPTAIYFHFKDKESLLTELCNADFSSLAQQFVKIARVEDPVERLRRAGHAYADFGLEHPNHYRLMFMTPHPPVQPEDTDIERGNPEQDAYAFLRATIAQCIADGRFRPEYGDAELVSQTVWAGVHGVIALNIGKQNDPWVDWRPLKKRIKTMIDVLVDGLSKQKRSK
jgi:AcrR family transcriptional regulator